MTTVPQITSPDDASLEELCRQLAEHAAEFDRSDAWPATQLSLCARYGVYRWFMPVESGGFDWSELDIVRGYLRLSAACLTTTFILTQRAGACRRIAECENHDLKSRLLPALTSGETFATVGISHLTTSRRHLGKPAMHARETPEGFVLDGYSPWVTGAAHAQTIALGATLDDGRHILVALPTGLPGVSTLPSAKLIALSASHTGELRCDQVHVSREFLVAGPDRHIMGGRGGAKTGGLQTSTLAIGLTSAALAYLRSEAENRADLEQAAASLTSEHATLEGDLLAVAAGREVCTSEAIRVRANSLVLRSAQAALAAAKGTGYVVGHPAGRWCREALFFLVWSCPQPVVTANLCELAGLSD